MPSHPYQSDLPTSEPYEGSAKGPSTDVGTRSSSLTLATPLTTTTPTTTATTSPWQISARERMVRQTAGLMNSTQELSDWRYAFLNIHIAGKRVSSQKLTQFTKDFADLIDARIPIHRALGILEENEKRTSPFRYVIAKLRQDIIAGHSLSEAIAKHPDVFDSVYCKMIAAGESASVLDLILRRIADFKTKTARIRDRVIGAALYQAAVAFVMVICLLLVMIAIIPKFEKIFDVFGTELPAITRLLLNISRWTNGHLTPDQIVPGWLIVVAFPFVAYFAFKLVRKTKPGKIVLDNIVMQLPVFSEIAAYANIAQFSRTTGTLLHAAIPLDQALKVARDTTTNIPYRNGLTKALALLEKGEPFTGAFRNNALFDPSLADILEIGEETGTLDTVFLKTASNYEYKLDQTILDLINLIDPLIFILLAFGTGFIAFILYLPMQMCETLT